MYKKDGKNGTEESWRKREIIFKTSMKMRRKVQKNKNLNKKERKINKDFFLIHYKGGRVKNNKICERIK